MTLRRGFTLIELIIAISIVALLAGMAMPIVTMANREAARSDTRAMLAKVDAALRLFKHEAGAYPFQDHPMSDAFPASDNRLAWHLAHDLTTTERAEQLAIVATYGEVYAYGGSQAWNYDNVPTFRVSYGDNTRARWQRAADLNRHSRVRARAAALSGNFAVTGVGPYAGNRILASTPAGAKGWAADYLAGEVPARRLRAGTDGAPEALLDRWETPLTYICPVTAGVPWTLATGGHAFWDERLVKLQAVGRQPTDQLASDMRTHAGSAFLREPEVWSNGPDRGIDAQRNESRNRDNVSFQDYHRGLR